MANHDLVLALVRQLHPNWQSFEDYRQAVPETVRLVVTWFRYLCDADMAVFLLEEGEEEACLRTFDFLGKSASVLQVVPIRLDQRIHEWATQAELTLEEASLHVAAHKARHYWQKRPEGLVLRDHRWWDSWVVQTFQERTSVLGKLSRTSHRLRKFAARYSAPDVRTEIDAEATGCACVANWRLTRDKQMLSQLVRS